MVHLVALAEVERLQRAAVQSQRVQSHVTQREQARGDLGYTHARAHSAAYPAWVGVT